DLGMPVRATSDGRTYKPLFAILCVDLDGRLNVNAHGCLAQTDTANYTTFQSPTGGTVAATAGIVSRGQGFGPAEVNLTDLFGNSIYGRLLTGVTVGTTSYQGRYGFTKVPGDSSLDAYSVNRWFDYGLNYGGSRYWYYLTTPGSASIDDGGSYGSPPDMFGASAMGLDQAGRPVFGGFYYQGDSSKYLGYGSGILNNPYEVNLNSSAKGLVSASSGNNLFGVGELERLLRPYDRDAASLPPRLAALTSTSGTAPGESVLLALAKHGAVTTESWDVPCPNFAIPWHVLAGTVPTSSILYDLQNGSADVQNWIRSWCPAHNAVDLLTAKYYAMLRASGDLPDAAKSTTLSNVKTIASTLLPPDLLSGLKMNINRPFGNGRDDDGNGVIDDPVDSIEGGTAESVTVGTSSSGTASATMHYDETGSTVATNPLRARQLEARYLYVLAMLLVDTEALKSELGATATNDDVARYLAQWAVNVVDFKDRDSIMTPFIYNPTPFTSSGWDEATYHLGLPKADGSDTHVVWGCERPELLISETLAFHDRRTKDTNNETVDPSEGDGQDKPGLTTDGTLSHPDNPKDGSFDQFYRPQGSLFVELYNPASRLEPRSGDLFTYENSKWKLLLTKIASDGTKYSPVWRMLIAYRFTSDTLSSGNEPQDPDDPANQPGIDREVYFVPLASTLTYPTAGTTLINGGKIVQYYPSAVTNGSLTVAPGGYVVVGSGEKDPTYQNNNPKRTYIGFKDNAESGDDSTHYIDLSTHTTTDPFVVHNNGTSVSTPPDSNWINPPATLAIDSPCRLSVSEPITVSGSASAYAQMETDGSVTSADTNGKYGKPADVPFDTKRVDNAICTTTSTTTATVFFKTDGTTPKYREIYLQRLANPLLPYDPYQNPYCTIDAQSVALTVFNGTSGTATEPGITKGAVTFKTCQRGDNNGSTASNHNLWKQEPLSGTLSASTAGGLTTTHYFNYPLTHSLGYLNTSLGTLTTSSTLTNSVTGETEKGLPSSPFPWLTWNNRPFASPQEVLLVPTCSSSKLLVNASAGTGTNPSDISNPDYNKYYSILQNTEGSSTKAFTAGSLSGADIPYPHLMNFFQSTASTTTGATGRPQFHRLLEYLGVPSPFAGCDKSLQPNSVDGVSGHLFHTPFNHISTYREPGRINLNTIYNEDVYKGLLNGCSGPSWNDFQLSRQGYGTVADLYQADNGTPGHPTIFAHPFRSFGGWPFTLDSLHPTSPLEINSTWLRADATSTNEPLFLQNTSSIADGNNTHRNPYLHYQNLMRLGNLVTTRSNVYAVWITVGYFEVKIWDPNNPSSPQNMTVDAAHADGYQLGRELGSDTGEVERHRAFYIIDRTLPVGFQRGQNLNADKAILVNRYIE
ncbi:MAG: hypothetical protein ABFC77_10945, partial [Thermoguttaceae bacterium]